jgi:hypothetical protein
VDVNGGLNPAKSGAGKGATRASSGLPDEEAEDEDDDEDDIPPAVGDLLSSRRQCMLSWESGS